MDIVTTKILVAVLFGLIRFVFGILPIKLCAWLNVESIKDIRRIIDEKKRSRLEFAVAIMQSFGGGVLFATSFLHMMPEVYFEVEELKEYGVLNDSYPYSQLIISCGFFTVYFAEEVSQWLISRASQHPHHRKKLRSGNSSKIAPSSTTPRIIKVPNGMAFAVEQKNNYLNENEKTDIDFQNYLNNEQLIIDNVDEAVQTDTLDDEEIKDGVDLEMVANEEIEEIIEEEVKTQQQMLRCFLMVMALSLHATFEGLAIGLQRSIVNIWYLFTAVAVHSATILFSVGVEVVLAGASTKRTMIHMSMLSGTSPFGVIIGLIITATTDLHTSAKSLAIILLEGLSAGTILYITFFEILTREKHRRTWRTARAISISIGFTIMALLECLKIGT